MDSNMWRFIFLITFTCCSGDIGLEIRQHQQQQSNQYGEQLRAFELEILNHLRRYVDINQHHVESIQASIPVASFTLQHTIPLNDHSVINPNSVVESSKSKSSFDHNNYDSHIPPKIDKLQFIQQLNQAIPSTNGNSIAFTPLQNFEPSTNRINGFSKPPSAEISQFSQSNQAYLPPAGAKETANPKFNNNFNSDSNLELTSFDSHTQFLPTQAKFSNELVPRPTQNGYLPPATVTAPAANKPTQNINKLQKTFDTTNHKLEMYQNQNNFNLNAFTSNPANDMNKFQPAAYTKNLQTNEVANNAFDTFNSISNFLPVTNFQANNPYKIFNFPAIPNSQTNSVPDTLPNSQPQVTPPNFAPLEAIHQGPYEHTKSLQQSSLNIQPKQQFNIKSPLLSNNNAKTANSHQKHFEQIHSPPQPPLHIQSKPQDHNRSNNIHQGHTNSLLRSSLNIQLNKQQHVVSNNYVKPQVFNQGHINSVPQSPNNLNIQTKNQEQNRSNNFHQGHTNPIQPFTMNIKLNRQQNVGTNNFIKPDIFNKGPINSSHQSSLNTQPREIYHQGQSNSPHSSSHNTQPREQGNATPNNYMQTEIHHQGHINSPHQSSLNTQPRQQEQVARNNYAQTVINHQGHSNFPQPSTLNTIPREQEPAVLNNYPQTEIFNQGHSNSPHPATVNNDAKPEILFQGHTNSLDASAPNIESQKQLNMAPEFYNNNQANAGAGIDTQYAENGGYIY